MKGEGRYPVTDQAAVKQALARHEAFWQRAEVNRPLVQIRKDRRRAFAAGYSRAFG